MSKCACVCVCVSCDDSTVVIVACYMYIYMHIYAYIYTIFNYSIYIYILFFHTCSGPFIILSRAAAEELVARVRGLRARVPLARAWLGKGEGGVDVAAQ